MSNNTTVVRSGGISAGGLLGIVFITLKLTGVINWSWVWVLAPFWIGFAVWLFVIVVMILFAILFSAG